MRTAHLLTVLMLAAAGRAQAQTTADSTVTLTSQRRAQEILARGIVAVGGIEALQSIRDVTRRLDGRRVDIGQGMSPGQASDAPNKMMLAVDVRGRRIARITRATIQGGQPIRWHYAVTMSAGFNADLGNGSIRHFPQASLLNTITNQARRLPEGALLSAWNRVEGLRYVGREQQGGRTFDVIAFADGDGAGVSLAFDAATNLLDRVEWPSSDPVRGDGTGGVRFDDWRKVGDLRLPYRLEEFNLGGVFQTWQAASVELNVTVPDSLFLPPAGLTVVTPGAPPPPEPLAQGVWLLGGFYTSLAIAFRDYVLVLEGGASSGWTQGQIAQIRQLVPDKPIRYVVATHWHHDHLSGLRSYIAEGVTIVTTPDAADVVRQTARTTLAMRPDALSRQPRAPVIETVADRRVFEDGTRRVELYQIGPNPHVNQTLVVYLPAEKILFQGDLFDFTNGRIMPGGEDTAHLAEAIRRLSLNVERVVSVHEGIAPRSALDSAVARRGRLGKP